MDGRRCSPSLRRLAVAAAALLAVAADDPAVRLTDAAESGTFTTGPATASVIRRDADALVVEYRLPPGTAAGVWAKQFPPGLAPDLDVVAVGVEPADADQRGKLEAAVEIKGTKGVQRVPVDLRPGRAGTETTVRWPAVGDISEVVVLLRRTGDAGELAGTARVDVRFSRLAPLSRLATSPAARIAGVLLAAAVLAAIVGLAGAAAGRRPGPVVTPGEFRRDFVLGAATVAAAALAAWVYRLADRPPLEVGWDFLMIAAAGAALAGWLKLGLTGRWPTARDAFLAAVGSGVPAAAAGPLAILQAPGTWTDAVTLSGTAAAAAVLVFHLANAVRLATTGRHLGPASAGAIVGTPFVVGGLLLLRADGLVRAIGEGLAVGPPEAAATAGRAVVLFLFNVLVAHGLAAVTRGRAVRSVAAHLWFLAVAVAVAVAPWAAAWGSGATVAGWPTPARFVAVAAAVMASQAALWAEVYLVTGMVTDALRSNPPTAVAACSLPAEGARKGAIFSGVFMAVLFVPALVWELPAVRGLVEGAPLAAAALGGVLAFPLLKTVIETFDGSTAFFYRAATAYRDPVLLARGAVAGLGAGWFLVGGLPGQVTPARAGVGFLVGAAAFAGVNLVRDAINAGRQRGRVVGGRAYLVQALLGGFVGAALGFYFDAPQLHEVTAKYHRYLEVNGKPEPFGVRPFMSKWGFVDLGATTGGATLLFAEALAGVIEWSIPAWLFAVNRRFLAAALRRETAPVGELFSADGLRSLGLDMIAVFRWGLWMSPVIKSFLRSTGDPTWYNQDGAVRTVIATVQDLRLPADAFRDWSLDVFVLLLASDLVRVLIWVDHMGLRVATLVNLSFLGMDRLDRRLARFLGADATSRCVPEAVKRFTTWAPLLLPFYIPKGADWDAAWSRSQALERAAGPGWLDRFLATPPAEQLLTAGLAVAGCTGLFAAGRWARRRLGWAAPPDRTLANGVYEVAVTPDGGVVSRVPGRGYDVSRRSYDRLDPAGRTLFLVDGDAAWPVVGNFPAEVGEPPRVTEEDAALTIATERHGLRSTVRITLPDPDAPAELWSVTVENLADAPRDVKLVPYLEWVLNTPEADRGHTQYNRLFAELEYVAGLRAVLAWDRHAKAVGFLAADAAPAGFLSARVDFIGRGRSLWHPRVLETLAFFDPADTDSHPTLDPIAALNIPLVVPPRGAVTVRLLLGLTATRAEAVELIARRFGVAGSVPSERRRKEHHPVRHGEVPPGTPQPYSTFSDDGRTLDIHTPFTPRPYDHALSNAGGHLVMVTNRGLHTTASVNSQQNRVTPDWPDTVTREVPGEAIYLHDPDRGEWFSPTYHPLNDAGTRYSVEFGVDGTAVFHASRGELETDLTVFVPPDRPAGVYRLVVRNRGSSPRRLRAAPYFQIVLAAQPEHAGPLAVRREDGLNAVFFESPRNPYRTGPAFAAVSRPAERVETARGRFFGAGRGVTRPYLVERGEPDPAGGGDDRPAAAFLIPLDVPPGGEAELVVLLGQADTRPEAEDAIRALLAPGGVRDAMAATRRWWLAFLDTLRVRTNEPAFDRYLDWLRYQALAERIWARRGFYQSSGAFGFRDQLQDAVNLVWADPRLARRQILLHAGQQFLEGDVVHWFHRLQDGRTGLVGRTHASDNLLWLVWATVDYLAATGDDGLLDEPAPYLESDLPFPPLPAGKHGMGFEPLRSARADTVYRHCLRAVDRVLDRRTGRNGLPLMGTGDWNDGLDEIGSRGKGESVWLGFFFYYALDRLVPVVAVRDGPDRAGHYRRRLADLGAAIERTWRGDRYLRAIHDDGTEIGVKGSGVWEIDALTAGWAVMAGVNPERGRIVFDTAVAVLERETTILLGWPPLREDTTPYLGRSSGYPEGVRENGMYCHGVQWLVGAARLLAEQCDRAGDHAAAGRYRETALRLWRKTSPLPHVEGAEIETYGGQPNKQAADMVTTFDPGRMIWHGYTGAAGWMFRQALEGVLGLRLVAGKVVYPPTPGADGVGLESVTRDVSGSPLG
jgi:cyclic beta-1,2-glucan synthetase